MTLPTTSTTVFNSLILIERNKQLYHYIKQLEDEINHEKLSIAKIKEKIKQVTIDKYENYKHIGIMEYRLACIQCEMLELQFDIIDLRVERQNLINNNNRKRKFKQLDHYEEMFERSVKFAEEQVNTNYNKKCNLSS
jgi:hypothetical protein